MNPELNDGARPDPRQAYETAKRKYEEIHKHETKLRGKLRKEFNKACEESLARQREAKEKMIDAHKIPGASRFHTALLNHSPMVERIVNVGFKSLATKLHPDKGGNHEAMVELAEARDQILKSFIGG